MDSTSTAPTGYLHSLRAFGDSVLGTVHDRLELFSVELQEEKCRLIRIFIWISAAVFTSMMVATFASLTLVFVFWESARLPVLIGLTLVYSGALVTVVVGFRGYLARQPKPFAATLHEITEDRSCFRTGS